MVSGFPVALVVKKLPADAAEARDSAGSGPGSGRFPWRRKRRPTLVFWPGESHGQRGLAGYSPWGHKESDMTEVIYHAQIDDLSQVITIVPSYSLKDPKSLEHPTYSTPSSLLSCTFEKGKLKTGL